MYKVAQADEPCFGEGEITPTESVMEANNTGCQPMLASSSTTTRVHEEIKWEEAITKGEVECAEDSKCKYKNSIIREWGHIRPTYAQRGVSCLLLGTIET